MNDDLIAATAQSQRDKFVEEFKNYGMLLDSMTPLELAVEIGREFPAPKQAAIIAMLAARLLESR